MPPAKPTAPSTPDAEAQIDGLIAKFSAPTQQLIRAVRKALQQRFPTANELVYDYTRNFVIGYSATAAGGEGVVALSADADGVRLYLTNGADIPDPHKLLQGKGRQARYIPVDSAAVLQRPEVEALIIASAQAAKVPLPATGSGEVIVKPGTSEKRPAKGAKKP